MLEDCRVSLLVVPERGYLSEWYHSHPGFVLGKLQRQATRLGWSWDANHLCYKTTSINSMLEFSYRKLSVQKFTWVTKNSLAGQSFCSNLFFASRTVTINSLEMSKLKETQKSKAL